jgi:crotonobetainyl-CoA:carnitine CoA-transferase CaiB-like acyl-CoA transferase
LPVLRPEEVFADDQVVHAGIVVDVDDPLVRCPEVVDADLESVCRPSAGDLYRGMLKPPETLST